MILSLNTVIYVVPWGKVCPWINQYTAVHIFSPTILHGALPNHYCHTKLTITLVRNTLVGKSGCYEVLQEGWENKQSVAGGAVSMYKCSVFHFLDILHPEIKHFIYAYWKSPSNAIFCLVAQSSKEGKHIYYYIFSFWNWPVMAPLHTSLHEAILTVSGGRNDIIHNCS